MTTENFEFSDVSDHKYNSETKLTMESRKNGSGGCFVSSTLGVVLVFLAVVLAVGVGVIVYFAADARDIVCKCDNGALEGSVGSAAITDKCKELIENGDEDDICSKCPATTASVYTTSSPEMTTSGSTTAPKVLDVRLPKSVIPVHYNIWLQPYMYKGDAKDFTFKGSVSIHIKCLEATNNVTLHIKELNIDASTLTFVGASPMSADPTLTKHEEDLKREFLILRLSKNMRPNAEYIISMNYTAALKESLKGLYLSKYERNNNPIYLASTQFQPTDARRAFPCFDEPAIKATFNVTLVRKQDLSSISNTPIRQQSGPWVEDGITYVADMYEQTPKMSTYLLAFVISDFTYTSGVASNNITYRAFSRPEVINSTRYALGVGLSVLPYFETYFETKYPLPKQDMIAIPDFAAGAMENWGLITYRETAMLYDPVISNENNKERVAIVVSHELAHQWFGDLVTPSWWDDLWLNEGFATFVEYMGVDHYEPSWKMFEQFVISDVQKVFDKDGLVTSHPVYVPVNNPDEINEIFDDISYSKGGSIIRMMRHFLGLETFRKGLVRYLHSREFDAAFHDDLWQALEDEAVSEGKHIKVKEIMDTWTLQMNYPVVTVTRDFNDLNLIHVSQDRFLYDPSAQDPGKYQSQFGYKWSIPLTLTSSVEKNFDQNDTHIHWLYKNETEKYLNLTSSKLPASNDPNGWIIANIEQNGFYRVNYQIGNWRALARQLETDHNVIAVINRAQIINDAWSLTKPGMLDMTTALNMLNYLNKEKEYIPWQAAVRQLGYVSRMISLTSTYGYFQEFMKEKTAQPYQFYGFNNTGAKHIETRARTRIASLACAYGIKACTDEAVRQYQAWMNDTQANSVDPNMKEIVYCNGINHGGWKEWQFALKMYKQSKVPSEQALFRSALSCSNKPWILNHYLDLVLQENSPIRSQDALTVIGSIGSSVIGRPLTWQFYRANFEKLASKFSSSFFAWSNIVDILTESMNTQFDLQELKALMEQKRENLGTAQRAFEQAIEKVTTNINWMEKNYPILQKWFSDKYASKTM